MTPKGAKASGTGRVLEKTIVPVLREKGFEVVSFREWQAHPESYGTELLLTHAPFTTIYGHPGVTEFLLKSSRRGINVRIECKWQQVSGSVDEKLPYVYLNAVEKMPEDHIIVVIDGAGWKPGAIKWLRDAVSRNRYAADVTSHKKLEVMSIMEFLTWANNTFAEEPQRSAEEQNHGARGAASTC